MKLLVQVFIGLTFALWIAFDCWLAWMGGPTESMVLRDWGKATTILPFIVGFLSGHWFMPRKKLWLSGWMWALPIFAVLIAWDVAWAVWVHTYPWYRFAAIWLALGIPAGSFLWGQPDSDSPI